MAIAVDGFSAAELDQFAHFQQQSYATLQGVARLLRAGMTEREVARLLRKRFHQQGVHTYFHVPVALFGERTAYPGNFGPFEALATDKRLETGMAVILDAAPIYEGYVVDTSLSVAFGDNPRHRELHSKLPIFRDAILAQVRERRSFRDIERSVHGMMEQMGVRNCHRKHIGEVLGHRVYKASNRPWNRIGIRQLSLRHVSWLLWKSFAAVRRWQDDSPNWNHRRTSAHPPRTGLWAVEPHFAVGDVGVKFEEILVITKTDAYWLDDVRSGRSA